MLEPQDEPQDMVAREYMTRKGLGHVEPVEVTRQPGEVAWLYSYILPDGGELDLVVEWLPDGSDGHRWNVEVDDFRMD